FSSGGRRPHRRPPRGERIHSLPEPEFIAKLRELNGTPEEVLQHAELMRLIVPILRADVSVHEHYQFTAEPPVELGISAFGGLSDHEVTKEDLSAWSEHTRGRFRQRMLPGDHFFLHAGKDLVTEAIARDVAELGALSTRSLPP